MAVLGAVWLCPAWLGTVRHGMDNRREQSRLLFFAPS